MQLRLLILILAMAPAFAAAETYRWVDENGQTHYTQVPPRDKKYDVMGPATPPAAAPNQDSLNRSLDESVKSQPKRQEEAAKAAQERAQRDERCRNAIEQLAYLDSTTAQRLLTTDEKGEASRVTEEEFEKRRAQYQQAVTQNCD